MMTLANCSAVQVYCEQHGVSPDAGPDKSVYGMLACAALICLVAALGVYAALRASLVERALAAVLRWTLQHSRGAASQSNAPSVERFGRGAVTASLKACGRSLSNVRSSGSCVPASPRSQQRAPGVGSLDTRAQCRSGRLSLLWDAHAGVRLRNVRLGAALRARLSHAFFDATELSAECAELELPGWRQPLRLRLRGARVELQQRALPRVRPARSATESGA